jgi:hypothetical protein
MLELGCHWGFGSDDVKKATGQAEIFPTIRFDFFFFLMKSVKLKL